MGTNNKDCSNTTLEYEPVDLKQKKYYRGELSTIETIIQVVAEGGIEGTKATKIANASSVNYFDTMKKCQKLLEAGLVESWREGRLLLFRATPKGLQFLNDLRSALDLARSINIRC